MTCPVGMMEKYFSMGELEHTSKACVFRGISVTKNGERLRKTGGLSCTRLNKISQLGYDPKPFGLHSLQAMQVCLTDYSSDMIAGNLKQPQMATCTSKIQLKNDLKCLSRWAYSKGTRSLCVYVVVCVAQRAQ